MCISTHTGHLDTIERERERERERETIVPFAIHIIKSGLTLQLACPIVARQLFWKKKSAAVTRVVGIVGVVCAQTRKGIVGVVCAQTRKKIILFLII